MDPPSYETIFYQPNSIPPSYVSYGQQLICTNGHIGSDSQDQIRNMPFTQRNDLLVPVEHSLTTASTSTNITTKLQAFYIFSSITYLLWGGMAIGLEISILVYSSSVYYRGVFTGGIMMGAALHMLFAACRVSYSINYMIRLLIFVLISCIVGVSLSIVDLSVSKKCINPISNAMCDEHIGPSVFLTGDCPSSFNIQTNATDISFQTSSTLLIILSKSSFKLTIIDQTTRNVLLQSSRNIFAGVWGGAYENLYSGYMFRVGYAKDYRAIGVLKSYACSSSSKSIIFSFDEFYPAFMQQEKNDRNIHLQIEYTGRKKHFNTQSSHYFFSIFNIII
ncbi:unnamed protein product [Rotaria socialis]|uniref:Transmembrane protein n=1 Tax=Rotaria socialis TaxID=392032 RepID=A0A820YAD6_9BILA|nr:unnamed protein product [Rotaria socialis]CAF3377926.1 unnamed protein product [Rotaria socialis]CAF4375260.1 unnamed protein product [Rotaria socialis]CAF4411486.1 unnamed protein product [Rotaria socialis]CAF4543490.1 unnamed protein product [Rotaria socialis]